jgi:hypothetical protein
MVLLLLDAGDDPKPGLSVAICDNRSEIVRALLSFGATYNVDATNDDWGLYIACEAVHRESEDDVYRVSSACRGNCMKLACRNGTLSLWCFFYHIP